jgi:hypothetical protein
MSTVNKILKLLKLEVLTDEEKESLKVAKLNQDKSEALRSEMDELKKMEEMD